MKAAEGEASKRTGPGRRLQGILKRQIDLWGSLWGLIFLSPLFLIAAIAIKLDSRGPVFFRQERVGRGGNLFKIWKLRTMTAGAANQGAGYDPPQNDPRITRVGRFLRNWGLDELPQLINVLAGEMSLVGPRPRPPLQYQAEGYAESQRQWLLVQPGITSWALIHGRNRLSLEERIGLDVWYVENWTFWLDVRIMLKTLWVVLVTREGVYRNGGSQP